MGMSHQIVCPVSDQIMNSKELGGIGQIRQCPYTHYPEPLISLLDREVSSINLFTKLVLLLIKIIFGECSYINIYHSMGCRC